MYVICHFIIILWFMFKKQVGYIDVSTRCFLNNKIHSLPFVVHTIDAIHSNSYCWCKISQQTYNISRASTSLCYRFLALSCDVVTLHAAAIHVNGSHLLQRSYKWIKRYFDVLAGAMFDFIEKYKNQ